MKQVHLFTPSPDAAAFRMPTDSAAARIRVAVKGARLSAAEQVTVAENLWEILERAVDRGISKARVLMAAGAGGEGDSTKRLERYALNPAWEPAKRELRAGRLTKSAHIYVRIAAAAGTLARQDADAYIVALFNGTRFSSGTGTVEPDDLYDELARLLRTICFGIARQQDLKSVFRTVDARHLCYYDQSLRRNPDNTWSAFWRDVGNTARITGLHDDNGTWSLPYPSVLIGWGLQVPPPREATLKSAPAYDPDALARQSLAIEVRLALLPIGPDGTPEPAFLTCPWTMPDEDQPPQASSNANGEFWPTTQPCRHYYSTEGGDLQAASFEAWSGTAFELAYFDAYGSRYPVRVDGVSAETCRRHLSLRRVKSPLTGVEITTIVDDRNPALTGMTSEQSSTYWRSFSSDFHYPPEGLQWRSLPNTLAETVENALLFDRNRLDATLNAAAARIRDDVAKALRRVDEEREQSKDEIDRRWAEIGDMPPPPKT